MVIYNKGMNFYIKNCVVITRHYRYTVESLKDEGDDDSIIQGSVLSAIIAGETTGVTGQARTIAVKVGVFSFLFLMWNICSGIIFK